MADKGEPTTALNAIQDALGVERTDEPAGEAPPPAGDTPPAGEAAPPAGDTPPADASQAKETSPGETPPGETPPGETPPGDTPPTETPPGDTPPTETPPTETPPTDGQPPAGEQPPGQQPPAQGEPPPQAFDTTPPEGLGEKGKTRWQEFTAAYNQLQSQQSEVTQRAEAAEAQIATYRQAFEGFDPNTVQNALTVAFDMAQAYQSGDWNRAQQILDQQARNLSLAIGKPVQGVNLLAAHPDLQTRVENLELSEADAQEIALAREQRARPAVPVTPAQPPVAPNLHGQPPTAGAPNPAHPIPGQPAVPSYPQPVGPAATVPELYTQGRVDSASAQVQALDDVWSKHDPDYAAKAPHVVKAVQEITATYPPEQWADRVRARYEEVGQMMASMAQNARTPSAQPPANGEHGAKRAHAQCAIAGQWRHRASERRTPIKRQPGPSANAAAGQHAGGDPRHARVERGLMADLLEIFGTREDHIAQSDREYLAGAPAVVKLAKLYGVRPESLAMLMVDAARCFGEVCIRQDSVNDFGQRMAEAARYALDQRASSSSALLTSSPSDEAEKISTEQKNMEVATKRHPVSR